MIEYLLHTGQLSTGDNFNKRGQLVNGIGSISNNNVLSNDIYINGQALLETLPEISIVAQREIITNSGDFFLSGNSLKDTTGFLNLNYQERNLSYDISESGHRYFYRSEIHNDLITGFSGVIGENVKDNFVFLNGSKLSSGESYSVNANNNFVWEDSDNEITGLLFSTPIRDFHFSTGYYDISNVFFNKNSTIGYLNGVRLDKDDYIETSLIVSDKIQSGLSSSIEFFIRPNSLNIVL